MAITIEVEKCVEFEDLVIQTPFYYKHDLLLDEADSVVYGKVMDDKLVAIHKTYWYRDRRTEFEIIKEDKPDFDCYHFYLTKDENKGSKEEYDAVVSEMKKFIEEET